MERRWGGEGEGKGKRWEGEGAHTQSHSTARSREETEEARVEERMRIDDATSLLVGTCGLRGARARLLS